jgi:hypothetical protein
VADAARQLAAHLLLDPPDGLQEVAPELVDDLVRPAPGRGVPAGGPGPHQLRQVGAAGILEHPGGLEQHLLAVAGGVVRVEEGAEGALDPLGGDLQPVGRLEGRVVDRGDAVRGVHRPRAPVLHAGPSVPGLPARETGTGARFHPDARGTPRA